MSYEYQFTSSHDHSPYEEHNPLHSFHDSTFEDVFGSMSMGIADDRFALHGPGATSSFYTDFGDGPRNAYGVNDQNMDHDLRIQTTSINYPPPATDAHPQRPFMLPRAQYGAPAAHEHPAHVNERCVRPLDVLRHPTASSFNLQSNAYPGRSSLDCSPTSPFNPSLPATFPTSSTTYEGGNVRRRNTIQAGQSVVGPERNLGIRGAQRADGPLGSTSPDIRRRSRQSPSLTATVSMTEHYEPQFMVPVSDDRHVGIPASVAQSVPPVHQRPREVRIQAAVNSGVGDDGLRKDEGRWVCEECGTGVTGRKSDLARHMETHRPKQYRCTKEGCGKIFSRQDAVIRHETLTCGQGKKRGPKSGKKRSDSD